jgi:uncharacterized protein (TIRG00374 family)
LSGFALLIATNRSDAGAAWRALRTVRWPWLALSVGFAAAWAVNQAALHAAAQRSVGLSSRLRDLLIVSMSASFLNLVTKSGGMAGLAAFVADGRRRERPRGRVVAAYLLAIVLGEAAFAVTLLVAIVVIAGDGHLSRSELLAAGVFVVYFGLRMTMFVAASRSRRSIRRLYSIPRRLAARLRRRRDMVEGEESDAYAVADELYDAVELVRANPSASGPTFVHALLVEVIGVAMLWSVLEALGVPNGVIPPLVAYTVSVLFTIVGFLPGGIGFVEVSTGAVLISFGVAAGTAAAAVVLYRVLELWLPALAGAAAAAHLRRIPQSTP